MTTTPAPRAASSWAVSAPTPRLEPVTMAPLPARSWAVAGVESGPAACAKFSEVSVMGISVPSRVRRPRG
ncbi:hypothetical protein ACFFX0_04160 [Citricoccus parietis]|uniref:Uncharacterized protein n=1 Tax=Citricoccus parietis TaxID=592307 RepID=A0ABV5FUR6_9MICC